jgi:hypothetical protein
VPIAAAVAISLLPKYRLAVAVGTTSLMSLFYFADLRAQSEVGQYISLGALRDMIGWAAANPGSSAEYVTPASLLKLAGLLLALMAVVAIGWYAERDRPGSSYAKAALAIPAAAIVGMAMVLAVVSYAARQHDSPLNATAVGRAVSTFFEPGDRVERLSTRTTFDEALDLTRHLSHTPPLDSTHRYIGRESDSDLIVFMMETGPARALDLAEVGRTLPGTGPLFDRAFVARQHYTTHPYSSDALYSVLSGLYPQGRRQLLQRAGDRTHNGLMTALDGVASLRAVYLPSLYQIGLDDRMYPAFGAQTVYAADRNGSDPLRTIAVRRTKALVGELEQAGSPFDEETRELIEITLAADFQALEKTKADITAAIRSGRRYAVLFFPEIGHAPWYRLRQEATLLERGRTVMLLQDAWLKEIVDTVRDLGRLEHTVIAVTADHGVRTRVEDPSLPIGRLSEYTFRVPLLVYAPGTLQQTHTISNATSHIDFAPTLLALIGRVEQAQRMQGVPIWERRPSDRLYFFASTYGGADGFTENGAFYMRQALSETVYRSSSLDFRDEDLLTMSDPTTRLVTDALAGAHGLQLALVSRMTALN